MGSPVEGRPVAAPMVAARAVTMVPGWQPVSVAARPAIRRAALAVAAGKKQGRP